MKSSLSYVTFKLIQIIRELKEEVLKLKELLIKEGYNPEELQCKLKMTLFLQTSPLHTLLQATYWVFMPLPLFAFFQQLT